jgi:glycosyltransferase involved in cell wall biosynthesis
VFEDYLPQFAIESALNQTYKNLEIIVIDNASTDNTKEIVKKYLKKGVKYYRNDENIGMMNNWNKCIELSHGKFLMILGDDDILYPTFTEEAIKIFDKHPSIGFTFAHINKMNEKGKFLTRWGYEFTPSGLIHGIDYLFYTAKYSCCLTNSSSVLMNKKVFKMVGQFEAPLSQNTFDFNMWIKIANKFDVYFINKTLSDYRIHKNQVSEKHWRNKNRQTGKIGTYIELFRLANYLLTKKEIQTSKTKYKLLMNRIDEWSSKLASLLKEIIPEL